MNIKILKQIKRSIHSITGKRKYDIGDLSLSLMKLVFERKWKIRDRRRKLEPWIQYS